MNSACCRILTAYRYLDDVTPFRFDCGKLCDKRCCSTIPHIANVTGMALLPHEKALLQAIVPEDYTYVSHDGADYALCSAHCRRAFRPFACRIFPFSFMYEHTGIRIVRDIASVSICPAYDCRPQPIFLRNMKKALRHLEQDTEICDYLHALSDEQAELRGFIEKLYSQKEVYK